MKKRSTQIQMIHGETWGEITYNYLSYFQDGWTVTIDEIANYLRCSYDYVLRNVSKEIPHIYINRAANKALYQYFVDQQGSSLYDEFFPLITKKYLYHLDNVKKYFLENMIVVKEELKKNPRTGVVKKERQQSPLQELPETLVSSKDLTSSEEYHKFDYVVLLRRYRLNKGIPKIVFKNLVRYSWDDFK